MTQPIDAKRITEHSAPPIPNHVSVDPSSPHYFAHYMHLGVILNGVDRRGDVSEFNVAEGWAKVHARNANGKFIKGNGGRITVLKIKGTVTPYYRTEPGYVS